MNTKRRLAVPPAPPQPPVEVLGCVLERGTEVSIRGKRGRFRFTRASTTIDGRLILDFIGGTSGRERWHSFYADRVTRVHRSTTMHRYNKRGTRIQ